MNKKQGIQNLTPKNMWNKELAKIMGGGKDTGVSEIQVLQRPVMHIQDVGSRSIIGTTTAEEGTAR